MLTCSRSKPRLALGTAITYGCGTCFFSPKFMVGKHFQRANLGGLPLDQTWNKNQSVKNKVIPEVAGKSLKRPGRYIYIYTCHCHCVFSWFLYKGHLYISHYFDETCYRTINIIWEQHHADFNTPNLPKILPQSWRIALSILVAGLQLMHALFQKRPSNFTSFHNAKTRTTWSPIASKHQVLTVRIHFNTGNAQTLNLLHSLQSLLPVQQKVKGIWKESSRHDYKQGWQQTA